MCAEIVRPVCMSNCQPACPRELPQRRSFIWGTMNLCPVIWPFSVPPASFWFLHFVFCPLTRFLKALKLWRLEVLMILMFVNLWDPCLFHSLTMPQSLSLLAWKVSSMLTFKVCLLMLSMRSQCFAIYLLCLCLLLQGIVACSHCNSFDCLGMFQSVIAFPPLCVHWFLLFFLHVLHMLRKYHSLFSILCALFLLFFCIICTIC